MSVYYFVAAECGMVKIGESWSPWRRLSAVQVHCPFGLTLAAIEPGGIEREAELHARFHEHRVRGEWFVLAPEIVAHIDTLERPEKPEDGRRTSGPLWRAYHAARRAPDAPAKPNGAEASAEAA